MEKNSPITYHISQDGSGDFATISQALKALEALDEKNGISYTETDYRLTSPALAPAILYIHNGTYSERITIRRPYLTLIGQSCENTILTGSLYARMPSQDIGHLGTFRSYSVLIAAHDVTLCSLTLENTSGKGPDVGQALALYADGDRLIFKDCKFLGNQDTLFTAPLPPKEIQVNGFVGPGQNLPRLSGRHYYKNCYLEGDIDFIFGGATAYFEDCELFSKDIQKEVNSYVTAASTPENQPYGYVFSHCRFTGSCPEHSAYLGRPWREYAKTVLLHCYIGSHIVPEGWHDWDKPIAHETAFYGEYKSTGPSSNMKKRPDWVRNLTPDEASYFDKSLVLSGSDSWNPTI